MDITVWDMYFAGIVSMATHPGFNKPDTEHMSIRECAIIADLMMDERDQRYTDAN